MSAPIAFKACMPYLPADAKGDVIQEKEPSGACAKLGTILKIICLREKRRYEYVTDALAG
jgi:hypothetical protein